MNAGARCLRPGRDLTLVLHGTVHGPCAEAARVLAQVGIEIEIIELPQHPAPDTALAMDSLRRTGRLACVAEEGPAAAAAWRFAAWAAEQAEPVLVRPVLRIALPAGPVPPQHLLQPLVQLVAGPRAGPCPAA